MRIVTVTLLTLLLLVTGIRNLSSQPTSPAPVTTAEYERWKAYLPTRGVRILNEVQWERGLSFYFHDPADNVLEISDSDIWPGR